MLALHRQGWGSRRIAVALGMSRNTVRRYLRQGGWCACRVPERRGRLAGLEDWLAERFQRHRGNAEVVRQELLGEPGIAVSLRTVQHAVAPLRQQLQIDFGQHWMWIGG